MKSSYHILFLCLFLFLFSTPAISQKKVLTDEEMVQEAVTAEIDAVFKSEDFLKKKSKKFKETTGTIVIDIGVVQNGKVSTFFKVDDEIKNPLFTNFISDYILDHKFYFKLEKQQRYKIRYTAIF
ncbi:hypothetical protein [Flavobacterium psychrotolerans]|uniref:TonB C-terminal domain-containing protein n=1 Tax=Flavobacterium psychrotolerans TaxID=2169410 RepID=A0A2U1JIW7_9FLAO|nr:hypothetical protein [Flavobacterium psychrotolerans]PWA04955.1 hypothetical protein DB895_09310 [Flavobacterium psychrotolerans]